MNRKEWWDSLSPRQQRIQLNKMQRGKAAKAKTRVKKGTPRRAKSKALAQASPDNHASFLAGGFLREIQFYARSNQVPESTLTSGIITILRHAQSGQGALRTDD